MRVLELRSCVAECAHQPPSHARIMHMSHGVVTHAHVPRMHVIGMCMCLLLCVGRHYPLFLFPCTHVDAAPHTSYGWIACDGHDVKHVYDMITQKQTREAHTKHNTRKAHKAHKAHRAHICLSCAGWCVDVLMISCFVTSVCVCVCVCLCVPCVPCVRCVCFVVFASGVPLVSHSPVLSSPSWFPFPLCTSTYTVGTFLLDASPTAASTYTQHQHPPPSTLLITGFMRDATARYDPIHIQRWRHRMVHTLAREQGREKHREGGTRQAHVVAWSCLCLSVDMCLSCACVCADVVCACVLVLLCAYVVL